jgi:hypothetical protein
VAVMVFVPFRRCELASQAATLPPPICLTPLGTASAALDSSGRKDSWPGGEWGLAGLVPVLWRGVRRNLSLALAIALPLAAAGCGGARQEQTSQAPPTAPAPTTPAPTATAAPQPGGAEIADLRIASVSAFSSTVAWRTATPMSAWVAAGPPDGPPTIWRHEQRPVMSHSITFSGLAFSTAYRIDVKAEGHEATLDITTAPAPDQPSAVARGGVLWVDGNPFFPLMAFEQCPDTYSTSLQVGINLFAGNRCGGLAEQKPALAGKALEAATADDQAADAEGTVGTFFPDEADGHNLTGATLPQPPPGGAGVRFLTLTSHFYSGAAPLGNGRAIYPGLVAKANVVGFDLYPLQGWCRPERLGDVFWAQRELAHGLARGKPTYQWIETSGMLCPGGPTAVTPATVRAESLLAIAGGARGLGFFPAAAWTGAVGTAIERVTRAVRYLGPGLFGAEVPASVEPSTPVLAGARANGGALAVVAVNSSYAPATATIAVRGLAGRSLSVFDEGRMVASSGDSFSDSFAPLAAHVYLAAPAGW